MDHELQNNADLSKRLDHALDEIETLRKEFKSLQYIIETQKNSWMIWRTVIKEALRTSYKRHPEE